MQAGIGGRVARATLWSGVNTVVTRLAGILITAVVVRMVTPHEFGVYAVALTVFTVVSAFSEFGLTACLVRHDLDPDTVGPTVALLSLIVGGALAALMAIGAGPLAVLLGVPDAADPLRVLSLCVALIGVFTVPCGLLMRDFRQDALLVATLVSFVPANLSLVLLAAHGDGAMAFAWSRVIGQVVLGAVLVRYSPRWIRPRFELEQLGPVLGFGVPLAGSKLVKFVLINADYLFIGRLMGAAPLGLYTLAFNVGSWSNSVLNNAIDNVALPAFSHARGEAQMLRDSLGHAMALLALVAFPIATVSLALAHPIIATLYGTRWHGAAPVLAVLSVYGALFVLIQLLGNLLIALGRSSPSFWLQVLWLAVLIPAMAVGVKLGGLEGAAVAHVIVSIVVVLPAYLVALRPYVPGAGRLLAVQTLGPLILSIAVAVLAGLITTMVEPAYLQLLLGGGAAVLVYLALAPPLLRRHLPEQESSRIASTLRRYDRARQLVTRIGRG